MEEKTKSRQSYDAPAIEVVELKLESVILITSGGEYPSGWNNEEI